MYKKENSIIDRRGDLTKYDICSFLTEICKSILWNSLCRADKEKPERGIEGERASDFVEVVVSF